MGYVKGKVERISIGQPIEPRNPDWGKSAKLGLEIDGKWWNGFVSEDKRSGAFTPKDKDYVEIKVGDEIEFMTTEKNGFENIDKKTMKVISATQQQPTTTTHEAPPTPQQPQEQPSSDREDVLVKRVCDGLAAMSALYKFSGREMPDDEKLERVSGYLSKIFKR